MGKHPLHERVGNILKKSFEKKVLLDFACKENYKKGDPEHKLPLFMKDKPKRENQYCNVDILIITDQNNKKQIKVILEIDESDIKPTQICGKFLTSAMSNYYLYKEKRQKEHNVIPLSKSVLFIQILKNPYKAKQKGPKIIQGQNLMQSIKDIIPSQKLKITKYMLMWNTDPKFESVLINSIKSFLEEK